MSHTETTICTHTLTQTVTRTNRHTREHVHTSQGTHKGHLARILYGRVPLLQNASNAKRTAEIDTGAHLSIY